MKLMMVAHGYVLHDPRGNAMHKVWLMPGQTIDIEPAWVAREIAGQEYKLVPAATNATETPKSKWPGSVLLRYEQWQAAQPQTVKPKIDDAATVDTMKAERKRKAKL